MTGYGRVILAIISFYFMRTNHIIASWCYIISALLDAVDGHAARYFNQAQLCNVRSVDWSCWYYVSFSCIMYILSFILILVSIKHGYWHLVATGYICIRLFCKERQVINSLTCLKIQLWKYITLIVQFLFFMCAGNEAFYAALYLLYFTEGPILVGISLFRLVMYLLPSSNR